MDNQMYAEGLENEDKLVDKQLKAQDTKHASGSEEMYADLHATCASVC